MVKWKKILKGGLSMKGEVRSPAMVVVLSIITCGIYAWYWLYKIGEELKNYLGDEGINPGMNLVLSIICFPYYFYVLYQYSKKITESQQKNGLAGDDNALVVVLLAIFGLTIVALPIMQNSLNKVWDGGSVA
jgi:hypothetical protein